MNLLRKEGLHLLRKGDSESDPGDMSDTSVECERRETVKSRTDLERQTDSWKEGEKTQSPASMIQLMSHIQVTNKQKFNPNQTKLKQNKQTRKKNK